MNISKKGADFIKQCEGLRLVAYRDPAGIPTIGYGHTGSEVRIGMVWTLEQADHAFREDIENFERGVERLVPRQSIPGFPEYPTQGQFDALVSFAFNLGLRALANSKLLRMFRVGDAPAAADQFGRWTAAGGGGRVLSGLVARRAAEVEMFST